MNWSAEIFYGIATMIALGLSWKRGGPIAVAGSLIAAMWLFQGLLYWTSEPFVGNMIGSMISASLILALVSLPRSTAISIILASLVSQLFAHVSYRQGYLAPETYYLTLNVLYIVQLFALGWSGGRIVLDGLGDWLADFRAWRNRVGMVWARAQETPAFLRRDYDAASRTDMGGIVLIPASDLRRRGK